MFHNILEDNAANSHANSLAKGAEKGEKNNGVRHILVG
jgi:hypothetical protein